jgi:serralysin
MKPILLPLCCAGLIVGAASAHGQASYHTVGLTYAEDFNSLNPAFNAGNPHTWVDGVTVPHFYASLGQYYSNNRTPETSRMYNLRFDSAAADQSLGSVPGLSSGTIYFGLRLVNDTAATLTSFSLSYFGEQWRNSGNAVASQIVVDWRLGSGTIDSGTWSGLPAATFTAIHTGGTAADLNGNLPANRTSIAGTVSDGFSWAPGQELWIRWGHANHTGTNHGLSIDDVTFTAIPEPGHFGAALAAFAGLFLLIRRNRSTR